MAPEKQSLAERSKWAEEILYGRLKTGDVAAKTGVNTSTVSNWCRDYTAGRIKVERNKGQRWFGLLAKKNGLPVMPVPSLYTAPTPATNGVPQSATPSITTRRTASGNEWSINIGDYRLTIDREPAYVFLEKITRGAK